MIVERTGGGNYLSPIIGMTGIERVGRSVVLACELGQMKMQGVADLLLLSCDARPVFKDCGNSISSSDCNKGDNNSGCIGVAVGSSSLGGGGGGTGGGDSGRAGGGDGGSQYPPCAPHLSQYHSHQSLHAELSTAVSAAANFCRYRDNVLLKMQSLLLLLKNLTASLVCHAPAPHTCTSGCSSSGTKTSSSSSSSSNNMGNNNNNNININNNNDNNNTNSNSRRSCCRNHLSDSAKKKWTDVPNQIRSLVDIVIDLIENTGHSAYLVTVSCPDTTPAIPGLVDRYQASLASLEVRLACAHITKSKTNELNPQVLVQVCSKLSKNLAVMTNICRHASEHTDDRSDQDQFKHCVKSLTATASCLISSIKTFKNKPTPINQGRCVAFCEPVVASANAFVMFAIEKPFIGMSAVLSPESKEKQTAILGACLSIVSSCIQVCKTIKDAAYDMNNARLRERLSLCTESVDKAASQLSNLLMQHGLGVSSNSCDGGGGQGGGGQGGSSSGSSSSGSSCRSNNSGGAGGSSSNSSSHHSSSCCSSSSSSSGSGTGGGGGGDCSGGGSGTLSSGTSSSCTSRTLNSRTSS